MAQIEEECRAKKATLVKVAKAKQQADQLSTAAQESWKTLEDE